MSRAADRLHLEDLRSGDLFAWPPPLGPSVLLVLVGDPRDDRCAVYNVRSGRLYVPQRWWWKYRVSLVSRPS